MFRVSYINKDNKIEHKGGFNSTKEAMNWVNENNEITPLKLLVWDEDIDCFSTIYEF